jgi:hypothetical protein
MRDARAAGLPVGVLTNDLHAFHSQEWVNRLGLDDLADVVVDGSVEGILKLDPRIYRLTAAAWACDARTWCFLTISIALTAECCQAWAGCPAGTAGRWPAAAVAGWQPV